MIHELVSWTEALKHDMDYIFRAQTEILSEGQEYLAAPRPAPILLLHTSGL